MTEAEQAALDLLRDMRETLLSLHEANMEKNSEISSLKDQMAAFQTADAQTAVAQEREWFDAFRSAVMPAPAAPVEVPAEEPVEG
jgi:signal transduction histidine kinase